VGAIFESAERRDCHQLHEVDFTDDPECIFLNRYGADYYQLTSIDKASWLASVTSVVRELLRDPWSPSLRTPLESFL